MEILTSSPKCSYCHSCTYNVVKNTPQPTPWANNLEQWRGVTATVLRFSTKAITWVLPKLYPWQVGWRQAWEATRVIFSVPSPSPPLTSSLSHAERESAASSPAAATPLSFRAPPPQPTPAAAEKGARPPPPPLPSRRGRRARAPWGKGRPRSSACARRGRRLAVATVTREAAPGPAASPPERPGAPPGEAPPRPQPHGSGRYLRLVREKDFVPYPEADSLLGRHLPARLPSRGRRGAGAAAEGEGAAGTVEAAHSAADERGRARPPARP